MQGLVGSTVRATLATALVLAVAASAAQAARPGLNAYRVKQDIVVGVNKYEEEDAEVEDILRVDPESEREQVERLKAFKQNRDQAQADKRLAELQDAARGDENLVPPIRAALKDHCSIGEVCGAMREVFGEYQPES